jgi:hypothetical protein
VLIGALAIAAIAAVIVVAIGGGGGSDQTEEQVASVVDTWASTTDPGECRNLATDRLLQQGPVSCSAPALQPPVGPDSVDVTNVQVSGDTATADALYTGGLFDGQTLALSLVKESDQWKVDQLDDLADFDLQRFADAFAAIAPKLGPNNRLPVDQANCVGNKLANQSPAVVAGKVLSAEFESYIEGLLAGCP